MSSVPLEGTRPSDAERDHALAVLREGAGSGRLSHDTFVRRMNFVLRAQSRGELADAIRDLPRTESRAVAWFRARLAQTTGIVAGLARRPVQRAPQQPVPGLALPGPGTPTVRVGRGPGATLRMSDITVSRHHAELRHVGDGWMLRDLGSMNGTEVNGLRITTAVRVRPGDRIRFGAVSFVLTWTD
ncbi:DUF1707 and FHA domain-containing protein [Kribbella sp. NPDC026611]|uniref:DUF1707 and FHA domain-containing protein n=1 Tax=Kribbella sp. NPDC026611 TaxID=3154911 RepID=UPI0033D285B2